MALELTVKELDRSTWPMTLTSREYPNGHPLTQATAVKIYVRRYGESTNAINGQACTADPDQGANPGKITYIPSAGDATALATALGTARSAAFEVEVVVTWTDTTTSRFPADGYGRLNLWESLGS